MTANNQENIGHLYIGDKEIPADAKLINDSMVQIFDAICKLDDYFHQYSYDRELFSAIDGLDRAYRKVENKMKELLGQKYWYNRVLRS